MSIATKCTCGHSFTFCKDGITECHHRLPSFSTPPSEAEGQVISRWVKASDRLPKYLGDPQIHYRLDGFQKVLGNFYHNESNELVFGVIGVTHKNYDIPKEKWGGLEWLEDCASHPAPSGPVEGQLTVKDYEEVLSDHKKLVKELDVLLNGENAAKQASLCDIVSQLRNSIKLTPVEADFETALEAEIGKIKQPNPELYIECAEADGERYGFEQGAEWARRYLASVPEAQGPWHLKSHANTEDDDTVWATDGKMSFYIDEFNFDDFPEADYWLVNFLNKYRFKLSIDESHQIVISHLEEQIAHLKSQQAGARWVRADRLDPKPTGLVFYKFNNKKDLSTAGRGFFEKSQFDGGDYGFIEEDYQYLEILIDSPAPEQVDPVAFADFIAHTLLPDSLFTGNYLLEQYTASLQNKQG